MAPKPSSSAIALAATLTSLTATAQQRTTKQSSETSVDPLSAPTPARTPTKRERKAAQKQRQSQSGEPEGELNNVDWIIEPFAFLGGNASWITSYVYGILPRIAPTLGFGARFNQDGAFSVQLETAIDFVGSTYYFYLITWYTSAATYLNFPLLARHRIQDTPSKRKYFTWGLQLSQKLGESYHVNLLGIPFGVYAGGGYYASFGSRVLSAAVGYQARRPTKRGGIHEFEMRLNAGLTDFGDEGEVVSNFMLRWNIVPRDRSK